MWNVWSYLIDFVASSFQCCDSPVTGSAVFSRPLKEYLQVVADTLNRSQIKNTIRTKNRLFSVINCLLNGKKGLKTRLNTFLVKIARRIVWKVVCETFSSLGVWCLCDISVPNIEDVHEPTLKLFLSTPGRVGHCTGLSWEGQDVIFERLFDPISHSITKLFVTSMMFGARTGGCCSKNMVQ